MKTKFTTITLILAAIGLSMSANINAQPSNNAGGCIADCGYQQTYCGGWHKRGNRGTPRMLYDMNLSDDQVAQINEIVTTNAALRHEQIRSILTPEQQAEFDARVQQRTEFIQQGVGARNANRIRR
ncbi:MAG: hypothetical protein LBS40_05635 [Burkholderiales bacterium]|jgi:Spy/CpxP family protein refolding chaperone|nr:hypothetical protein [Burkholderiales bacterium]